MGLYRNRTLSLFCLLFLALPLFSGCQQSPAAVSAQDLSSTVQVTRGSMSDVVQLSGQVVALNSRQLTFGTVGGRIREIKVQRGQEVKKGQELVTLDTADQERKLREAQADLRVAEAVLASAQRTAGEAEIAQAKVDLTSAEYEVEAAKYRLTLVQQSGLISLEEAVATAQAALQVAQDQYRLKELELNQVSIRKLEYDLAFFQRKVRDLTGDDRTKAEESLSTVERDLSKARADRATGLANAAKEIADKQEALATAQANLNKARSSGDDPAAAARLAYEQALAKVDTARKKLESLQAGTDSQALKAAKTAHEAAVAKVESAQATITASTLVAPFDGVVFEIYVKPDERVQATAQIVYLADPRNLRVQAQATELDVAKLNEGQEARITFDSQRGKVFTGKVLPLPARGTTSSGVSIYPVELSLVTEGASIQPGVPASIRVVLGEKQNVLLVPAAALQYQQPQGTIVIVRNPDGTLRTQEVKIGLNDGIMAEVLSGVSEGETLVLPLVAPTDPSQFRGGVGIRVPQGPIQILR